MNFNRHSNYEGLHAFLGASKYHWINYDKEKLIQAYRTSLQKLRGTQLHEFAATCIRLGQKLPRSKKALNQYVNDAIGFGMSPEVVLFYSENCFGTADTISFRDNFLRIHDYKSGDIPAHMEQLLIYAALFCLEYNYDPYKIRGELRLYQFDGYIPHELIPSEIAAIMAKIIEFDKLIMKIRIEEE